MKDNSQKGFAIPIIIAIVALAVIIAGGGYFYIQNQSKETAKLQEQKKVLMEREAMEKKEKEAMMGSLTYNFIAQNNSGEAGTVTFSEASKDTTSVVVSLNSASKDVSQPAHIHIGSCKALGIPSHTLTNLVNGKSVTVLNVSYENLWKEVPFAVNVHKSSAEVNIYTACADVTKESAIVKKEGGVIMVKYTGTVLAGNSAPILDFTKADYGAAVASDKLVVLYFYANWCPICKIEFPQAKAAFNELNTDRVVGFRVNYKDNQTDADEENLARQFGVPYQHTKVFLKNGKQILKAPDSWDKTRYITEINKAIAQ